MIGTRGWTMYPTRQERPLRPIRHFGPIVQDPKVHWGGRRQRQGTYQKVRVGSGVLIKAETSAPVESNIVRGPE